MGGRETNYENSTKATTRSDRKSMEVIYTLIL
jgi:hypothetical protein